MADDRRNHRDPYEYHIRRIPSSCPYTPSSFLLFESPSLGSLPGHNEHGSLRSGTVQESQATGRY